MGKDLERRTIKDRRKWPTPFRSFYTFFGRRRRLRRKLDQQEDGYLDRYSPVLFFLIVFILALNILDSLFTMIIIDLGGRELNPIVQSIISLHGDRFWIWKFLLVSSSLVILSFNRRFKLFRQIVILISSIYLITVLYQVYLIAHLSTPAR